MDFRYQRLDAWPPLAWLAVCRRDASSIEVRHGSRVETRPDWFAEAVWDGPYEEGDLDRTDLVYGSGGRIRGDAAIFVSPATTVDRLHHLEAGGATLVSNSLACLLAAADADVDPDYPRYFDDFETVIRGIGEYRPAIATSAGPATLTYYENLEWRGGGLCEVAKPSVTRDLSTFAAYRRFLETSLAKIGRNMRSEARQHRLDLLATISSGYDSPTVAALARCVGLRTTLSFSRARDHRPDSGAEIARRLGLEPIVVESGLWREEPFSEVPFIASDAKGEDVYYHGAKDLLRGRVVLTGYGGSRVWDKGKAPPENFARSDQSGLSLCEFRLWAGFLHCPLTFLGGRQTEDLRAISNSPEMQPWDVPGDYSRPICRRVLEEAGIPRTLFGMEKKAASILFFDRHSFLSPASLADYRGWLGRRCRHFQPGGSGRRAFRWASDAAGSGARRAVRGVQRTAELIHTVAPVKLARRVARSVSLAKIANQEPLFSNVFPWALAHAKKRYDGKEGG